MNIWYKWCNSVGESRAVGDIPPINLDKLLAHFFTRVKRQDGSCYEPATLTAFHRSLERHLRDDLGRHYSILLDRQFALSREALIAARKKLKKEGKGNRSKAADPLEKEDFEQLWESGALGEDDPETLQNSVWLMLCMHMGMRGQDEHHKLKFADFEVKVTSDGKKYVEFNERDTKTRTGASGERRAFKPKMWSNTHCPDRCPVRLFELFVSKRPPEMCKDDSPFYLATNLKFTNFWYKRQPMGINKIGSIMKRMAEKADLKGRKTNHTARKTSVETLYRAQFQDSEVMQFTGHRNVASLNSYKKPCLEQQRRMSEVLSSNYSKGGVDPQPIATSAVQAKLNPGSGSSIMDGIFAGASISACTLNFNVCIKDEHSSTKTCSNATYCPHRKRPLILDSDSEYD